MPLKFFRKFFGNVFGLHGTRFRSMEDEEKHRPQ